MAEYVTGLLVGRVYGAGVYAAGRVHVEYWQRTFDGLWHDTFRSVTVLCDHLQLLNAGPAHRRGRHDRQTALLGDAGSDTLARLRVAVSTRPGSRCRVTRPSRSARRSVSVSTLWAIPSKASWRS